MGALPKDHHDRKGATGFGADLDGVKAVRLREILGDSCPVRHEASRRPRGGPGGTHKSPDRPKDSGIPLYIQVREQIRLLIHKGVLKPGQPVPTVWAMAVLLGINLNTVARIYRDLEQEKLLVLRRGLGTFVSESGAAGSAGTKDFRKIEQAAREFVVLA